MDKDFKVLAIDPGGTSGFCQGVKVGKELRLDQWQKKLTPHEFYEELMFLIKEASIRYFVCESFEFRKGARAGLDLTPAHLIGVVMAHIPEDRLKFQTAATGKGYWTDDHLKEVGAYVRGIPHAMDATRHLLQWYKFGFGYQFYEEGTVIVRG